VPRIIAASFGIARDSPQRIKAADDGHCYLPEHLLIADATKILGVAESLIAPLIPDLAAEELAVRDEVPVPGAAAAGQLQAVHLSPFYHSERSLAASLSRLLSSRADSLEAFQSVDWEKALGWQKAKTSAELAPSRPTR